MIRKAKESPISHLVRGPICGYLVGLFIYFPFYTFQVVFILITLFEAPQFLRRSFDFIIALGTRYWLGFQRRCVRNYDKFISFLIIKRSAKADSIASGEVRQGQYSNPIPLLYRLPDELVIHTLKLLSVPDLCHLSLTSKKMFSMCRDKVLWHQLIRAHFPMAKEDPFKASVAMNPIGSGALLSRFSPSIDYYQIYRKKVESCHLFFFRNNKRIRSPYNTRDDLARGYVASVLQEEFYGALKRVPHFLLLPIKLAGFVLGVPTIALFQYRFRKARQRAFGEERNFVSEFFCVDNVFALEQLNLLLKLKTDENHSTVYNNSQVANSPVQVNNTNHGPVGTTNNHNRDNENVHGIDHLLGTMDISIWYVDKWFFCSLLLIALGTFELIIRITAFVKAVLLKFIINSLSTFQLQRQGELITIHVLTNMICPPTILFLAGIHFCSSCVNWFTVLLWILISCCSDQILVAHNRFPVNAQPPFESAFYSILREPERGRGRDGEPRTNESVEDQARASATIGRHLRRLALLNSLEISGHLVRTMLIAVALVLEFIFSAIAWVFERLGDLTAPVPVWSNNGTTRRRTTIANER